MLAYARFRGAGGYLRARAARPSRRALPLGAAAAGAAPRAARGRRAGLRPGGARRGARRPAAHAAAARPAPHRARRASRSPSGSRVLRGLLRRGAFSFDEAVEGADRMTVAVTLFALLELYKRGEAGWEQDEPFGPITVRGRPRRVEAASLSLARDARGAAVPRARPRLGRGARRRAAASRRTRSPRRCGELRRRARGPRRRAARARRRLDARLRTRTPRRPRGACSRRPRTPALTPAQAETLSIVAYLQPVSRPEIARIRGVASESATAALVERGLIEEAGRSQFGAVLYRTTPLFLKLFGLRLARRAARPRAVGPEPGGAGRAARPAAARRRERGGAAPA